MVGGYSKQFAGLVTGYAHKYRFDPFFRTQVNVVALQLTFAGFLLLVVGVIASTLYHDASTAVSEGISKSLSPNASFTSIGSTVVSDLSVMRSRTVIISAVTILCTTVVFTYIIMYVALTPTRKALESQKQFIGNVAHELRTPLSISKTNIEVALMEPTIEASLQESLISTVDELDRISEIINNLLTLSSSVRPERMEFRDVDLGEIVNTVVQKLRTLAEPKHLTIETKMGERRVVLGNSTALEQVLMNVLKNAIAYTPSEGNILISVEPIYPNFMELTVRDSGRGIARKNLFRIFEPYYRADPSRTRADGGSGLGLTIVSELVKLHHGKIAVRSAEGRGTTITILLPAGRPDTDKKGRADVASEVSVDFTRGTRTTHK